MTLPVLYSRSYSATLANIGFLANVNTSLSVLRNHVVSEVCGCVYVRVRMCMWACLAFPTVCKVVVPVIRLAQVAMPHW